MNAEPSFDLARIFEAMSPITDKTKRTGATFGNPELVTRLAVAEAELRGLKDMVAELRQSRDAWQAQAERATLALTGPERRPWWKRLAG